MPKRRNYTVKWTAAAEHDLDSIIEFIADDNIDEAMRILIKVKTKAQALHILPERGRIVLELKEPATAAFRSCSRTTRSPTWSASFIRNGITRTRCMI